MLGHKNVATTQIYADMADEIKRQSVDRITLKPKFTPQLKIVGQDWQWFVGTIWQSKGDQHHKNTSKLHENGSPFTRVPFSESTFASSLLLSKSEFYVKRLEVNTERQLLGSFYQMETIITNRTEYGYVYMNTARTIIIDIIF